MKLIDFLNTRFGIGFALSIARYCPPRVGYGVARFIAKRITAHDRSEMVRAMRANLWVVGGRHQCADELDFTVREILANAGRCHYDFYHNLGNPVACARLVEFDERMTAVIERMREAKEGTVVVSPHMSNFDLTARVIVESGVRAQLITLNHAAAAYRRQDNLRRGPQMDVTPVSLHALRLAIQTLRSGGSIFTGADRPIPGSKHTLNFFGRPAALPVHHIYLATKVNVPVAVVGVRRAEDGVYHVTSSELITMQQHADKETATVRNAEHVLNIAADYIRSTLRQWSMFYPVWPEAIDELERAEQT